MDPISFEFVRPGGDRVRMQVLEDGTIKTDTDKISMPNHNNAETFLREVARLAGGKVTITLKGAHMHEALHRHTADGHTH